MKDKLVLIAESCGPQEREVLSIARCEEADMWTCGELGEKRRRGGATKGSSVKGVDKNVVRGGRR